MFDESAKELNYIYDYFKFDNQIEKLYEECNEFLNCKDYVEEISEIADVFILSAQLVLNNPEIMKEVLFKIERTKQRIKDGYYKCRI